MRQEAEVEAGRTKPGRCASSAVSCELASQGCGTAVTMAARLCRASSRRWYSSPFGAASVIRITPHPGQPTGETIVPGLPAS
jgi:hypothetical protein